MPHPAAAAPLYFSALKCINSTLEPEIPVIDPGDEPYVVMFAANISGGLPITRTLRTRVFADVDAGEWRFQTVQLWPAAPIPVGPLAPIFLVALIESDAVDKEARAELIRTQVQTMVTAKLAADLPSYLLGAIDRAVLMTRLRDRMKTVIDAYKFVGAGDEDDLLVDDDRGGVQQLTLPFGTVLPGPIIIPVTEGSAEYDLHFVF
jgi:hypothetical protein